MTDNERRTKAKEFYEYWKDRGYEKGESQPFWLSLLRDVLGVEQPEQFINFEIQVSFSHTTNFIDGYIPTTHVLIEQKSRGKDLRKGYKQSDGSVLTPYEQAHKYASQLSYSQRPRWIVTSNFDEILIYDMQKPNSDPQSVLIKNLHKEYSRLQFLVDAGDENIQREMEVSIKAGRLVGTLYDEILKQYHNPENPESLKSLNVLCVRLVFCLYAEDAGVFGGHNKFLNYISSFSARDMRRALIDLFRILDTPVIERDKYEYESLLQFPYVNGGLFKESNIEIPQFNDKIRDILLTRASAGFDWSDISPTIFGAVFESTLNPETRRSGGMHYTSIENIHKVIDPLFLNDLSRELEEIKAIKVAKTRAKKLEQYREKLGTLTFLDPACGSGNFLTETYISLRRLENEAIKLIEGDQILLDMGDTIKVTIDQFYGIEINDFAVAVAKAALWIAESQMMKETEDIIHKDLNFLPLKSNAYIVEGNALRLDWNEVVDKTKLNYIMGNPPFVGYSLQSTEQKQDILSIYVDENGKPYKTAGKIDYVAGWYFKASEYINGTDIRVAFVSTNSITQGEQVASVWKPLYERFNINIDFAHTTFRWDSESNSKAHVHCVIIGFSTAVNTNMKQLYASDIMRLVENINFYLVDADVVFVTSRTKTVSNAPIMQNGGKPSDGGFLILTYEEKEELIQKEPLAEKWLRPYVKAKDFIDRKPRYCLWLVNANPSELKKCPSILARIEGVRQSRLKSSKIATQKKALTPTLFDEIRDSKSDYVAIPGISSENRKYIPIEFLSKDVVPADRIYFIPNATKYHFGVLTSNVHMAWTRAVCGRLKSDYSYSNTIVYNNFPWATTTEQQKADIEKTAQAILDARALYPDCSLADLYDELTMPVELRKAHQANDLAVMKAYGFSKDMSESAIVAELMKMYQELTK